MLKMYPCYNSGFFRGAERHLADPVRLTFDEKLVASEIANRLEETQREVVALDLGAMLGASMIAIATQFQENIASGQLHMIATNKEAGVTPRRVLEEATRRLQKFDSPEGWEEARNNAKTEDQWIAVQRNRPFIPDHASIGFLAAYAPLVQSVDGVDTLQLPGLLDAFGLQQIDVVHERFGGLYHHHSKKAAIATVTRSLRPETGVLVTIETPSEDPEDYGDIRQVGLQPDHAYSWADPGYKKYHRVRVTIIE